MNWSIVRKSLIVLLSVVLVLIIVTPGRKMRKERQLQQTCRLRLESLSKAQERYFALHGKYASELTELSGDNLKLTCPSNDSPFILDMPDSLHYKISCPNGHGWVSETKASWKQE